ncbi:MAG: nitrous oxide reductase family maturation protein NosD [Pseudomonadota bacterium]
MRILRLMVCCALSLAAGAAGAARPLQALIDATPAGGVLRLAAGDYAGPATIDKPLTLEGGGRARLLGGGRGTVLGVATDGAVVRGLTFSGSGDSHDAIDAGILVAGDGNTIEDNVLEDVLFGIHVRGGNRNRIAGNRIVGKNLPTAQRGDVIRVWNGRHNRIEHNRFFRARDLTLTNSPDNAVVGNRFADGRYGMHLVFSPRLLIEGNRIERTQTGIVAMYSPELTVRGNQVRHVFDGGGAGLVFKDSGGALVERNEVVHCSAGLMADAPLNADLTLTLRANRFAHNLIGLSFHGELGGHRILANRFENNLTQIFVSAPGVGASNVWEGNYWSDYQGFDRDGDGIGDTPHENWLYADRIWMETPPAAFFRNSPVLELIDFLERLAPFSLPHRILSDPRPRMR